MNKISRSKFCQFSSSALALLTTVLIATSGASAKEHKVKAVDSPARVVAHIPFAGLSTVDMTCRQR
jgi:hypothetical protein